MGGGFLLVSPYLLRGRGWFLGEGQFDGFSSRLGLLVQTLLGVRLRENHEEVVAFLTLDEPC
jgi:hypothetical protein